MRIELLFIRGYEHWDYEIQLEFLVREFVKFDA